MGRGSLARISQLSCSAAYIYMGGVWNSEEKSKKIGKSEEVKARRFEEIKYKVYKS